MPTSSARRRVTAGLVVATACSLLASAGAANATTYPSDTYKPDLVPALTGFNALWTPSGSNNLQGTVKDATTLKWNDRLASWINQNATSDQKYRALVNSAYLNGTSGYDQSLTIADGLGAKLGADYVKGRLDGSLPLTTALINSSNGSTGAYISTTAAKTAFSYPRPFLNVDPSAPKVSGDADGCAPSAVNGASLKAIRTGEPWADADGNLRITRVPATTDTSHTYATTDVTLDAGYGTTGICTGGAFPSGHTTTAYQAGITLATLLPELAPQILARASEAGNNRIVLGVHYPLDIVGGRIAGEAALAARWSDASFRKDVLVPARAELVNYLQARCGNTLVSCIAADTPYANNPYGGVAIPGGTSQVVTDRASALKVYTERLGYGFAKTGASGLAASVPKSAANLLLTTFPTLTDAQRLAVLAQTEIASGYPLDTTADHDNYGGVPASWQRLNLAAAMSASVQVNADGSVKVLSTGGKASVVTAKSAVSITLTVAKSQLKKGKRATLGVRVAAGKTAATGKVTVSAVGKKITATLNSSGVAKVKLPKFTHTGTYKVKVAYPGSATLKAKTITKTYKVTRH